MAEHAKSANRSKAATRWAVIAVVVVALLVMALLFRRSSRLTRVVDGAMAPTLRPGDTVVVALMSFEGDSLVRGDIVLVRSRPEGTLWLRRVVGLPGETVSIKDDDLFVNGEVVAEPYAARGASLVTGANPVGPRQVLLLPDNRQEGLDIQQLALELTPVPIEQVVGRATRILWPFSRWRALP